MKEFNTVALGYFNSKGELVAWSSDTFGSPSEYPKTYTDSDKTRAMLNKKFTGINEATATEDLSKFLENHNGFAAELVKVTSSSYQKFFVENDVVEAKVMKLDLVEEYVDKKFYPTWAQVKECVDEGNFKIA